MSYSPSILLFDDNQAFLDEFRTSIGSRFQLRMCDTENDVFAVLHEKRVDVLLLDLMLGKGLEVLKKVKNEIPHLPVIILAADASVETAVEAMRLGAYHYTSKSPDMSELTTLIERALADNKFRRDYQLLREERDRSSKNIIGKSVGIRNVLESIERVAQSDVTVLIVGESGTGKELVARAIHQASKRTHGPFVAVNCGSLVKDLVESELFGHQKGAFTGAIRMKPGKFELAEGGTIFLDEVGDLDLHLQVKILRVLQEKEFDRIGGTSPIHSDVLVITATHRDLTKMVQEGQFREDLYYRLNVYPITIPPLREHPEDIPLLVEHYVDQYAREFGRVAPTVRQDALECLTQYKWPGNVRELQNVIQRSLLISTAGVIEPEHLPKEIGNTEYPLKATQNLRQLEKEAREFVARRAILDALGKTDRSVKESARILGIPEKTLYDRCKKLGIKLHGPDSEETRTVKA